MSCLSLQYVFHSMEKVEGKPSEQSTLTLSKNTHKNKLSSSESVYVHTVAEVDSQKYIKLSSNVSSNQSSSEPASHTVSYTHAF